MYKYIYTEYIHMILIDYVCKYFNMYLCVYCILYIRTQWVIEMKRAHY